MSAATHTSLRDGFYLWKTESYFLLLIKHQVIKSLVVADKKISSHCFSSITFFFAKHVRVFCLIYADFSSNISNISTMNV
jgi:hypothetical protein